MRTAHAHPSRPKQPVYGGLSQRLAWSLTAAALALPGWWWLRHQRSAAVRYSPSVPRPSGSILASGIVLSLGAGGVLVFRLVSGLATDVALVLVYGVAVVGSLMTFIGAVAVGVTAGIVASGLGDSR